MKLIPAVVLIASGAFATPALAQEVERMWRCQDKDGTTEFTNVESATAGKNCRLVRERVMVVPAGPTSSSSSRAKSSAPSSFPKETPAKRASAKEKQRQILEQELEQERSLLERSKQALAEQEAVRYGDERNYARVLARLKPYQDTVELHQKNVEALERELTLLDK